MAPTVSEDTLPAEADCGFRRFIIATAEGSRISVQISQDQPLEDCPGEIFPACQTRPSHQVCSNEQITQALIQIASITVRFSGQSLPV